MKNSSLILVLLCRLVLLMQDFLDWFYILAKGIKTWVTFNQFIAALENRNQWKIDSTVGTDWYWSGLEWVKYFNWLSQKSNSAGLSLLIEIVKNWSFSAYRTKLSYCDSCGLTNLPFGWLTGSSSERTGDLLFREGDVLVSFSNSRVTFLTTLIKTSSGAV